MLDIGFPRRWSTLKKLMWLKATTGESPAYETASGAIASFEAKRAAPLQSLIVNIDPVQSGSGDPSPDNVRPITGWTQVNIPHTGVNICGGDTLLAAIEMTNPASRAGTDADGRYYQVYSGSSTNGKKYVPKMFFKPNTRYTFVLTLKTSGASGSAFNFRVYYTDGTNAGAISSAAAANTKHTKVFTTAAGKTVSTLVGYNSNNNSQYLYVDESGIFEGVLTAADFVAPAGGMETIDMPETPGTVYGGTLDVVSGVLTVTMANIASYAGESIGEPWISSKDVYSPGATPTTGAQVVYTLTEPQTYPLTPVEVTSLLGKNNIWADTGNVSVTYRSN